MHLHPFRGIDRCGALERADLRQHAGADAVRDEHLGEGSIDGVRRARLERDKACEPGDLIRRHVAMIQQTGLEDGTPDRQQVLVGEYVIVTENISDGAGRHDGAERARHHETCLRPRELEADRAAR